MSEQYHLQQLVVNYTRRLHKLKEQQALSGLATDPAILIEIEDIEVELDRLQAQLAQFKGRPAPDSQAKTSQEVASPNSLPHELENIETRLAELQTGLAALEKKLTHQAEPKINQETASLPDVQIDLLPSGLKALGPQHMVLLQMLYRGQQRVMVEREFGGGFGGTRVLLVRPITSRGRQLARQIVKIGPSFSLKQEQQNYDEHVSKAHPFVVAPVTGYAEWQGLGGIIYNFVGDSRLGPPRTLEEVFLDEQISAEAIAQMLVDLLDKALGERWYHQTEPHICFFDDEYGPHLIEHLRVRIRPASQDGLWATDQASNFIKGYHPLSGEDISAEHAAIQAETLVQIEGLVITKVKPDLIKLQHPTRPGIVVKVETQDAITFTLGQAVIVRGEVRYNRPARLAQIMTTAFVNIPEAPVDPQAKTLTWGGKIYPNPLKLYPDILSRTLDGKKSFVHGDLHLRNILVDESGHGWLIDFALVKERHNLYDFIKLEVYIRQMVLSQADSSFADYVQFEEALLDEAVTVPDDPALRKAYKVIWEIREMAAGYARNFENEYLPALFLYSLAVVKYVDNHGAKAARLAFGTAGVVGRVIKEKKLVTENGFKRLEVDRRQISAPTSSSIHKAQTKEKGSETQMTKPKHVVKIGNIKNSSVTAAGKDIIENTSDIKNIGVEMSEDIEINIFDVEGSEVKSAGGSIISQPLSDTSPLDELTHLLTTAFQQQEQIDYLQKTVAELKQEVQKPPVKQNRFMMRQLLQSMNNLLNMATLATSQLERAKKLLGEVTGLLGF